MSFLAQYMTVLVVTITTGIALIATKKWHGRFTMDGMVGVQKLHTAPTPRIGGVAIAAGLMAAWFVSPQNVRNILGPTLVASLPALVFGLAEDLSKRVGVLARLLATMASGGLAWYLTGVAMQYTGFSPLDWVLEYLPLAVLFTAFAVGGVANSINIIDGFNGLAVGAVAIMLIALSWIATGQGDASLASASLIAAWCAIGFATVNWPMGRLFLGDGGAYLLGFVLAWFSVLLPMRSNSVNAWATIMVCAYPVIEVGFSVRRRRHREGHHPGQADRLHLHHLIHRRVVCKLLPNTSKTLQNGLTSPLCWILVALPAAWAVAFSNQTWMLALGFGLAVLGYAGLYARLTQFKWCVSAATLVPKPAQIRVA